MKTSSANVYSRDYLSKQKLAVCHLSKLKFSSQVISSCDREWSQYLEGLGISCQQGIKLVTEAALLGSAIEHGLSPDLIILSDGAKQFAILVHALCWGQFFLFLIRKSLTITYILRFQLNCKLRTSLLKIKDFPGVYMERSLRRLNGVTAQKRQEIEQVQDTLWAYYRELKTYQEQPTLQERERLKTRFDEIFQQRYPHHYGLNLVMQQFCAHKDELLRVLDAPQVPLHTNAAETDLREYVTRRKISGGTRHDNGRRARDTFTGLKKTCRKLALSFWQYLLCRLTGDETVPYLPDVIRARATVPAPT